MSDRWPLSAFGDEIAPDLETQIEVLRRNGVGHVEFRSAWGVNITDMGPAELDRAAGLLDEAGIRVSAIGSPVGKSEVDGDFEAERGRFARAISAAQRLGTPLIRVFSFFIPEGRYGEHRDEVLRRMAALARTAEERGVVMVHENESYIYGDVAERCRDVVESVGSPALRLAFDPANFVQTGVRPHADAWPLLASHVAHFHVKDAVAVDRDGGPPYPAKAPEGMLMLSVRPPGEGDGELPALLSELAAVGYHGFLTVEPHLRAYLPDLDGPGCFEVAVRALRGLVDGLD